MSPGAWAAPTAAGRTTRKGTGETVALVVAALLSLGYAAWAFTARRGIFSDFSAGRSVSSGDARSSDALDTFLLIVAGLVALVALALWLWRFVTKRTRGGGLDIGGLVLALVGVATVVGGLVLASRIASTSGQAAQGDKGVTATLVVAIGFAVLALGLLIGSAVVRGRGAALGAGTSGRTGSQAYPTPW